MNHIFEQPNAINFMAMRHFRLLCESRFEMS